MVYFDQLLHTYAFPYCLKTGIRNVQPFWIDETLLSPPGIGLDKDFD